MRVMYTHNEVRNMTKAKIIKEIIRMAARCHKTLKEETLTRYSEDALYDKYLTYRNKYILFYKGER